jgi:hypothetical protein
MFPPKAIRPVPLLYFASIIYQIREKSKENRSAASPSPSLYGNSFLKVSHKFPSKSISLLILRFQVFPGIFRNFRLFAEVGRKKI